MDDAGLDEIAFHPPPMTATAPLDQEATCSIGAFIAAATR
jgi:hypothetical protein